MCLSNNKILKDKKTSAESDVTILVPFFWFGDLKTKKVFQSGEKNKYEKI